MENNKLEIKCPKEWVIERLREHELDYDYKTDALKKGDLIVEEALTISFLRLDARQLDVEEIRAYIKDALAVYRHERSQVELNMLVDQLAYVYTDSDPVAEWATAVCGKSSTLDTIVMKHFIWQVKRKLAGLSVERHMMPVLWGKSGIGKSVAVSRLIEPLSSVALQTDMGIFGDQFSRRAFSRNYLVFFDELQGSESANINSMKQIITAPVIEWRAMRSERVMSAPQNSTFIGCSNDPVRDRIKDSTSSRRFWQINCSDQIDWDAINRIDYLALWRSVDEKAASPILNHLEKIKMIQESEIRTKDLVEQWLDEACEVVTFDESSLTTSELYEPFKEFCLWQGQKSFPQFQKFARDIKRILEASLQGPVAKKTNRGTTWCIKVRPREAVSANDNSDSSDNQMCFNLEAA
jgi:hypothetical protein